MWPNLGGRIVSRAVGPVAPPGGIQGIAYTSTSGGDLLVHNHTSVQWHKYNISISLAEIWSIGYLITTFLQRNKLGRWCLEIWYPIWTNCGLWLGKVQLCQAWRQQSRGDWLVSRQIFPCSQPKNDPPFTRPPSRDREYRFLYKPFSTSHIIQPSGLLRGPKEIK
jgi:hypothetical protein